MERVAGKHRRKPRPVSELITLFDHQDDEGSNIEQWTSENALNTTKPPKTLYKEKPTIASNCFGNSAMSKSSESVFYSDAKAGKMTAKTPTRGKTELILTLKKPKSGKDEKEISVSSSEPEKKSRKPKQDIEVPKVLQGMEPDKPEENLRIEALDLDEDEQEINDDFCRRKKFPLDDSLAVLRREMHSLRKQDVELMNQLLALNSSIQEFKSPSNSSSMSNFSDISDAETDVIELEQKPPARQAWYQRESSGSDSSSDLETRGRRQFRPHARIYKRGRTKRDGLDSEVICYYSNTSPSDSVSESNQSLTGYDVSADDNDCPPISPLSSEPPFQLANRSRQKAWSNLGSNGRTRSDLNLHRKFPEDGGVLHSAVQSRAFFPGDEKVRKLIDQKKLYTRRNTTAGTQSPISGLSHHGSDRALNSDGHMSSQSTPGRLQKWQRSRSTCSLNSGCRTPSPVLNTIKVDLRKNPPMGGTVIELVLPISPLQPTRRSSAVRMAERRPLTKLNTLNKRQSTIW